jgi:hypothetical protein
MIIGLSGYAQSGKDTVAKFLIEHYGFERVAFADPIRDILIDLNPILENGLHLNSVVNEYGWEMTKKKEEVRRLLQSLGLSARTVLDQDIWVIAALRKMEEVNNRYVVTDVRFENEAVMIKQLGGQVWRIQREFVGPVNDHISESELDNWEFDRVIHNNSTVASLELAVKTRMAMLL